jgi:hypothetical protein
MSDGRFELKYYDSNGHIIEHIIYNSDRSLNHKYISLYDDKGYEIEDSNYKSDGSLDCKTTYKYDYDKNNNWIRKIKFVNGKAKYITERVIEYY